MKKFLTIICSLCLVMAFAMPAAAVDDIQDNQAAAAFLGQTNQAQKGGEIDNDGLDVDTGDIASGNLSGNTSHDGDETNVDVKTGDLLSGNTSHDGDETNVDVKTGDLLSNNTDNTDNSTNVDVAFDDVADMQGADAAAALGGFAIAVDIDNLELNLASTTSTSQISQTQSAFSPSATATASGGDVGDDVEASSGLYSKCLSVDTDIYDNIGVMGANFSAGNFNNQANLNSVNVTVQY
jgi:hypothetical protein